MYAKEATTAHSSAGGSLKTAYKNEFLIWYDKSLRIFFLFVGPDLFGAYRKINKKMTQRKRRGKQSDKIKLDGLHFRYESL